MARKPAKSLDEQLEEAQQELLRAKEKVDECKQKISELQNKVEENNMVQAYAILKANNVTIEDLENILKGTTQISA